MPQHLNDWVPFINTTDEIIPGGALMGWTDVDENANLLVTLPTANSQDCLVNGPTAVSPGKGGQGTFDNRVVAAYDPDGDLPQPGEVWGAADGSWYLTANQGGFLILGGAGAGAVNAVKAGGGAFLPPTKHRDDIPGRIHARDDK